MNLKNKLLLCICMLFLVNVTGCGINEKNQKAYDNVEQIAKQGDNHNYTGRSSKRVNDNLELNYKVFSGTDTIWILKSKENGEITVNYDSTVNSGDFKVVLAYPDTKEVENILEGTKQGNQTIQLKKGECRLKLVGRNAEGSLKISITGNKNLESISTKEDD